MKKAPKKGKSLAGFVTIMVSLLAMAAPTWAEYPTKPIKWYIGFHENVATGMMARMLVGPMEKILGQPITLINKPGGAGGVVAALIKNSEPDGYTIGGTLTIAHSFIPNLSKDVSLSASAKNKGGLFSDMASIKVKYTKDDFTYIAGLGQFQSALVCRGEKPWKDFADLIQWAKKNSETQLTYASVTPIDELFLASICEKEGVKFKIMYVKNGASLPPAILGGDADFGCSDGAHLNYLESGEMKVLATMQEDRQIATPDVPTMHEFGYPLVPGCFMAIGPKDLPKPILDKLTAAFKEAVNDKEYQGLLRDNLYGPPLYNYRMIYTDPDEVAKWVDMADKFYKDLITRSQKQKGSDQAN